jgi:Ca2+-transporting ATPase
VIGVAEPWAQPANAVLRTLGVTRAGGLTAAEARQRRRRFGPNRLRQTAGRGAWRILVDQLTGWMVLLLVLAAAISFAFGQPTEGLAILVVIVLNTAIGFGTELHAARSMDALRRLGQAAARVRRGGRAEEIRAVDLVPGDIVLTKPTALVSLGTPRGSSSL